MTFQDQRYYSRRREESLARARVAGDASVARAHQNFADAYESRIIPEAVAYLGQAEGCRRLGASIDDPVLRAEIHALAERYDALVREAIERHRSG